MQEQQKEIMARMTTLSAELQKALEKKDQAEIARVQKEMEKVGQGMEKLGKAQEAIVKSETGALNNLSSLRIRMSANAFSETQPARMVREHRRFAGNAAYAYSDPEGKHQSRMMVMVGPWKRKTENRQVVYEAAKATLPHTRVQTVTVTVTGDPSLTSKVLEGVNWKALQALIK
jgi:precorrin-2 methylase